MAKSFPLLALLALGAVGCSAGSEISKQDEAKLKNNFTRSLTPEEMAKMGGSKKAPNDKL